MSAYKNIVPLFDIDLTLLAKTSSRGSSFEYAIKKVLGKDVSIKNITTHGMIDPEIFIEILKYHGYDVNIISEQKTQLLKEMENHFFKNPNISDMVYEPMPGVRNLLEYLANERYIIGVLTGNTERVARFKLKQASIDSYFTFGLFGDGANKRKELSEQAKIKVSKYFPASVMPKLVIVGDAPKDIYAAHEAGLPAIGIGAGKFSVKELLEAGADGALETLEDKNAFVTLLKECKIN